MGFGSNKGFTPGTDAGGGGDVSGPGASTDHAIARWDGVNGDTLLDSVVTIADNGEVVIAPTAGAFDALHIDKDDASILLGDAGHIKIIHGAHYTSSAGITLARINTGGGSPMKVAIETGRPSGPLELMMNFPNNAAGSSALCLIKPSSWGRSSSKSGPDKPGENTATVRIKTAARPSRATTVGRSVFIYQFNRWRRGPPPVSENSDQREFAGVETGLQLPAP